eukprot:TRINITY_DN8767_c0_g1_i1.p1 TRINITY_DN8767_c0_g1~~TRINITY_DN8767_c0_g1_i1.p1  ORF type:complete len:874 (+),score=235.53 TRINITY_DN8767_c0_g1_i1:247-2868(+)
MTTTVDAFLLTAKEDFARAIHSKKPSKCQRLVHHATTRGLSDQFFKLLSQDSDIIFKAAQMGDPVVLKMLHDGGLSFDIADSHQNTPLIIAASSGQASGVEFLLSIPQVKLAINSKRMDGNTALHRAAEAGSLAVVRLLVNNLATYTVQNNKAQTPLDRAKKKNKRDVVKYLTAIMNGSETPVSSARQSMSLQDKSHLLPLTPTSTQPSNAGISIKSLSPSGISSSDCHSDFSYERNNSKTSMLSELSMSSASATNSRHNTNDSSYLRKPIRSRGESSAAQVKTLQAEKQLLEAKLEQLQESMDSVACELQETKQHLQQAQQAQAKTSSDSSVQRFEIGMGSFGKLIKVSGGRSSGKTNQIGSKWRGTAVVLTNAYLAQSKMQTALKGEDVSVVMSQFQAILELKHSRVVPCFGYTFFTNGEADPTMCLVYERNTAMSLHELLYSMDAPDKLMIEWDETPAKLQVVDDIVHGLMFLHMQGLVHGSLNSNNVLVHTNGQAQLADMGLTRCRLLAGKSISTTKYTSPELIASSKNMEVFLQLEASTDVYSAGVLLLEVMTGCDVEGGANLTKAVDDIEHACLQLLVRCMMTQDAACRPCMLTVAQVISVLRGKRASQLDLKKGKVMLAGPANAAWKPPTSYQPGSTDAAFASQIKCLPVGDTQEAFDILQLDGCGLPKEKITVHLLLKPDAQVGFYNHLLHWSALTEGASDDANHPFHSSASQDSSNQKLLAALASSAVEVTDDSIPEHVHMYRAFAPFVNVKAANKALMEGITNQALQVAGHSFKGARMVLDPQIAVEQAQAMIKTENSAVLVCDVVVANPWPVPAQDGPVIIPAHHDCGAYQAAKSSVVELLCIKASMLLPRAVLNIDDGSFV